MSCYRADAPAGGSRAYNLCHLPDTVVSGTMRDGMLDMLRRREDSTPRRRTPPRRKPLSPHRLREAGRRRTSWASPPSGFPTSRGFDDTDEQSARTGLSALASDISSRKVQGHASSRTLGRIQSRTRRDYDIAPEMASERCSADRVAATDSGDPGRR